MSRNHVKGFALIGVAVAMMILAVMGAGLAALVSTNSTSRMSQKYSAQSFYITHAGSEFALNNLRYRCLSTPQNRLFLGTNLVSGVTNNKVQFDVSYGSSNMMASNAFSIAAPPSLHPNCIYILAQSGSSALDLSGNANFGSLGCGINVNSSSSTAVTANGNAHLSGSFLNVTGNVPSTLKDKVTLVCPDINTGTTPITDPLASYAMPNFGSTCTYTNFSVSGDATLNPGTYCGGIKISGSGTITFNPGNYYIDGGDITVSGTANIVANGVTLFLDKQNGSGYPTIKVTGSGNVSLSAPTTGPYAGIAIFQSRNAPSSTNQLAGGSTMNISGAVYLPNQSLSFSGGSSSSSPCTLLIVSTLSVTGDSNVSCSTGNLAGLVGP